MAGQTYLDDKQVRQHEPVGPSEPIDPNGDAYDDEAYGEAAPEPAAARDRSPAAEPDDDDLGFMDDYDAIDYDAIGDDVAGPDAGRPDADDDESAESGPPEPVPDDAFLPIDEEENTEPGEGHERPGADALGDGWRQAEEAMRLADHYRRLYETAHARPGTPGADAADAGRGAPAGGPAPSTARATEAGAPAQPRLDPARFAESLGLDPDDAGVAQQVQTINAIYEAQDRAIGELREEIGRIRQTEQARQANDQTVRAFHEFLDRHCDPAERRAASHPANIEEMLTVMRNGVTPYWSTAWDLVKAQRTRQRAARANGGTAFDEQQGRRARNRKAAAAGGQQRKVAIGQMIHSLKEAGRAAGLNV